MIPATDNSVGVYWKLEAVGSTLQKNGACVGIVIRTDACSPSCISRRSSAREKFNKFLRLFGVLDVVRGILALHPTIVPRRLGHAYSWPRRGFDCNLGNSGALVVKEEGRRDLGRNNALCSPLKGPVDKVGLREIP